MVRPWSWSYGFRKDSTIDENITRARYAATWGGEFSPIGGQTIRGTKKSRSCGLHASEGEGSVNEPEKDQTSARNGKYTRPCGRCGGNTITVLPASFSKYIIVMALSPGINKRWTSSLYLLGLSKSKDLRSSPGGIGDHKDTPQIQIQSVYECIRVIFGARGKN